MSLVPFTFKNVELKLVTINDKPWARAKEVCEALGYKKRRARDALKKHVSIENKQHKNVLQSRAVAVQPVSWPQAVRQATMVGTTFSRLQGHC